jgi:hypothetical protein
VENEPVRLAAAVTMALSASLAVLAFGGVSTELIAALNAALAAVVALVFEVVRGRVDGPARAQAKQATIDRLQSEATTAEPVA